MNRQIIEQEEVKQETLNEYDIKINYLIRENCMNDIMNMDKKTFINKLKENSLPEFIRATKNDKDYKHLYRDTNFIAEDDYAYNHRERLRKINVRDYKNDINFLLNMDNKNKYNKF